MTNKYLLLFLLLLFQQSFGQVKNYNFININSKDGLASNTVYAIYKDKLGFMWFGTEDGLNKFDGQNFTVYRHKQNEKESIGRGEVMGITEDKNRNIWIGTKLTLALYNRSSDKFTNFDFTKTGWIHTLSSDHLGNIWVGTYNGLFYFDVKKIKDNTKATENHMRIIHPSSNFFNVLIFDDICHLCLENPGKVYKICCSFLCSKHIDEFDRCLICKKYFICS